MNIANEKAIMWEYGPAALCRMDESFLLSIGKARGEARIIAGSCLAIVAGAMAYGYVFGMWRSPLQGLYSAIKMPLLMFSIVLAGALINTLLAQALGARLTFRQTCLSMLLGMAITSVILGAWSPVMLFFVLLAAPSCAGMTDAPAGSMVVRESMIVYGALLACHVGVIGLAGLIGNLRLYGFLRTIIGSRKTALRLMTAWLVVTGFVGCELSWLISPFLARPDLPIPFFNPNAFKTNFFEYLWRFSGL